MIETAVQIGQKSITTFVKRYEKSSAAEVIHNLESRGFKVSCNGEDLHISLPPLARYAQDAAYDRDSVVKEAIKDITESILILSKQGYVEMTETWMDLADTSVLDIIKDHFIKEGFRVTRKDTSLYESYRLVFNWSR